MKLLIDSALSWRVAQGLADAGHDAIHTRERGLASASDEDVTDLAAVEDRIIVSADTDFGEILALRGAAKPSFVLLRPAPETSREQLALLIANLPQLAGALEAGAVAVIESGRIRLRMLPIEDDYSV